MKRIPLAFIVFTLILIIICVSQLYIYNTCNELNNIIEQIEQEQDVNQNAEKLKATYAQKHRWLMMISDNNLILQLKMLVDTLDHKAEAEEIIEHTKHIKVEIMRIESLLLALL